MDLKIETVYLKTSMLDPVLMLETVRDESELKSDDEITLEGVSELSDELVTKCKIQTESIGIFHPLVYQQSTNNDSDYEIQSNRHENKIEHQVDTREMTRSIVDKERHSQYIIKKFPPLRSLPVLVLVTAGKMMQIIEFIWFSFEDFYNFTREI